MRRWGPDGGEYFVIDMRRWGPDGGEYSVKKGGSIRLYGCHTSLFS